MGCDIHPAIEYRKSATAPWHALMRKNPYAGRWEGETEFTASLDIDRNYDLFAILGNVRNGRGFAGIVTGSGFDPMSDCRGVPEDISPEAKAALSDGHSATWVILKEILEYNWDRSTTHIGVVNGPEYTEWQRCIEWNAAPKSYCDGVSGGGIVNVSEEAMKANIEAIKTQYTEKEHAQVVCAIENTLHDTYTKVSWSQPYTETTIQMWTTILPPMLNLGRQYGYENVRLVMDFDS